MEEKYVLVSLEDERAGKLANVLGNKTCKKILDLLAEKELSETEISKQLKIPLNTADYNIKNLVKAGLIDEKKHFFSVKGKRIPVYKISNKNIVISPKKISYNKLKTIFPVVFISAVFSAFVLWYFRAQTLVQENIQEAPETLMKAASGASGEISFLQSLNPADWFLIVTWLIVIVYVIFTLKTERRFN